jgi:hypothetical protein
LAFFESSNGAVTARVQTLLDSAYGEKVYAPGNSGIRKAVILGTQLNSGSTWTYTVVPGAEADDSDKADLRVSSRASDIAQIIAIAHHDVSLIPQNKISATPVSNSDTEVVVVVTLTGGVLAKFLSTGVFLLWVAYFIF